jgi:hypothetical protein
MAKKTMIRRQDLTQRPRPTNRTVRKNAMPRAKMASAKNIVLPLGFIIAYAARLDKSPGARRVG